MAEVVAPSPAPAPASAVSVASSDAAPRLVDGNEIHEPLKKHPLEHSWTIWFDNTGKTKQSSWGSALRSVYTFSNVEDFWWYVPPLSDSFLLRRLSAGFFPFFLYSVLISFCSVFYCYECAPESNKKTNERSRKSHGKRFNHVRNDERESYTKGSNASNKKRIVRKKGRKKHLVCGARIYVWNENKMTENPYKEKKGN